jgi:hypothetical protein
MGVKRNAFRMLCAQMKKQSFESVRRRNVRMDVRVTGYDDVNWNRLAQVRVC